jgi:hypothetical protein
MWVLVLVQWLALFTTFSDMRLLGHDTTDQVPSSSAAIWCGLTHGANRSRCLDPPGGIKLHMALKLQEERNTDLVLAPKEEGKGKKESGLLDP